MTENVPETALFVCFGAMSNVGMMTGLAAIEAVKQVEKGKAGIFCLGGLPTQAPTVIAKTQAVKRIVTVDGCPLNCSRKIVEMAGFTPTQTINLVTDCNIQKKDSSMFDPAEMKPVVEVIVNAINN
ncbi:MAG: putative zinc-binding protein [Anaerolineaceae bacterium]